MRTWLRQARSDAPLGSKRPEIRELAFQRALRGRRQGAIIADLLYRVLLGRPASLTEQAEMRQRAIGGVPIMELAHELKAGAEGSRVTIHGTNPALRTYLRAQFDSDSGRSELPRLVFLHFMKVGGTSLSDLFGRWFPLDRARVHMFVDDLALTPPPVLANLRVIAGHIPFAALDLVPPPYHTMVVLREPLSRTLSHYSHLVSADLRYRDLTLDQFVSDETFQLSGNYQARQLAHDIDLVNAWRSYSPEHLVEATGADPLTALPLAALFDSGPMHLSDEELLDTASTNLAQIDFVGTTDRLDAVARRVAELFDVPPEPVSRLNVSPSIDHRELDGRIRRKIESRTAVDRELYELAKHRALSG